MKIFGPGRSQGANNTRNSQEGSKYEQNNYQLNSLNYPNNVLAQNNRSTNQRIPEENNIQYFQNLKQPSQQNQQNKVFNDSHDENLNSNDQNQFSDVENPMISDNVTLGEKSRSNQNNQNFQNLEYNPSSQIPVYQQIEFANPNYQSQYQNPYYSMSQIGIQQKQYPQTQYQQCPSHPKYDITNICVAETCIEPLCPECVKIHTYMHNQQETPTSIDTILWKRDQCVAYVRELKQNFVKEQAILNKIGDIEKGDIFQQCLNQIQKAKDLLFQNINSYFNAYEFKIKQKINEVRTNQPHLFGSIHAKIQAMIHQVQDMEQKLQSPQYVKYIIQILSDDFNMDFDKIRQDVDYGIDHYLNQLFKVQVQPAFLEELEELLQKYVTTEKIEMNDFAWRDDGQQQTHQVLHSNLFSKKSNQGHLKNKENYIDSTQKKLVPQPLDQNTISFPTQQTQMNQNLSNMYDMQQNPFESVFHKQSKGINNFDNQNAFQNPNPISSRSQDDQQHENKSYNSTKEENTAHIDIFDYFTPECPLNIMHFFQDNSKLFHFLDLSQLSKDVSTQVWQTVELKINFKIPMFHRSIITPNGKVYLIGGIDVLHKNKSVNSTYFLDMNRNTLELCAHMNFERNSHSLVVAQDSIFVVGGQNNKDEDIYLSSCERFDIETQKWIQIADVNEGVCGTVLSNFNDKYIYRFGGKTYCGNQSNAIERYDIHEDYWEEIPFNFNETIPCFAGACQINDNEMIILGGQVGEINQRQVIVARNNYSEQGSISFYSVKSMPTSGTIWQNPIIGGNVIFAMQNIKMENSQMNYFSKKSLFIFNKKSWKELGSK